ncbi:MAG: hypothetical protein IPM11_01500 [Micropruina sp.]|nr:hypothetical protein [Micropruina sp.]
MKTLHYLAEIPDLAWEALATRGTRPASEDGPSARSVPHSLVLADLDRLLVFHSWYTDPLDDGRFVGMSQAEIDQDLIAEASEEVIGLGVLFGWARIIFDEDTAGAGSSLPKDDVAEVCNWLSGRAAWASQQPWADEYAEDIKRLRGELRRICRIRTRKPWPCLTPGCEGVMQLQDGWMRCDAGHEHAGLDRYRFHASIPATAYEGLLNVSEDLLRQWSHRGKLHADDSKGKRPKHFFPWDVLRVRYPDLVALIEEDAA